MVTCCNGNFYGGGFNPIKDANPADGQMNVLLTKNISRLQAAGLIGAYGDGRYYEVPDVITRVDTNKVHVKLDKVSVINIDGEAIYTDDLTVELIPGAVNFIVPEGMTYFDKKPE
jgi:diacylglycerol kinase family enzyme